MFAGQSKYTLAVCEKTCYQQSMYDICGCCDENYPCWSEALVAITRREIKNNETVIEECDESNRTVIACMATVKRQFFSGSLECVRACKPPCREVVFHTTYATGSWPGDNFKRALVAGLRRNLAGNNKTVSPESLTAEYISKNYMRLEVYFETFVEEVVRTKPAYDWNRLFSDIGGNMGLWLGFSVMTAVELLELLFDLISCVLFKLNHRKTKAEPDDVF